MSLQYLKKAVAIGNAKEAALFFDEVVPLDLIAGRTQRELDHSIVLEAKSDTIINSLLPGVTDAASFYRGHSGVSDAFWDLVALQVTHQDTGSCEEFFAQDPAVVKESRRIFTLTFDESLDYVARNIENHEFDFSSYRNRVNSMLNNGIRNIGFDAFSKWVDPFYEEYFEKRMGCLDAAPELTGEDISAVLHEVDLVDADKLSWEDIVELRSDKEALGELRDLRLFLHENIVGLGGDLAVDKVKVYLERYRRRLEVWRLETVKKSLAMVVSKEGLGLTALGVLASIMVTGIPADPSALVAAVSAAAKSGAVLNLGGGAAVQLMEARVERKKVDASPDSSIRYLQRVSRL